MTHTALHGRMLLRPAVRCTRGLRRHQVRLYSFDSYVVTPKQLDDALKKNAPNAISTAPRTIPICAAWFMPNDPEGRTGPQAFKNKRIPTARFFDIDQVKDHDSPYPHMLPTCDLFAEAMSKMGVRKDDELVVYDTEELGLFSAPRVAWTMRVYGHPKVHILNNFRIWCKEGYPVETDNPLVPNITKYSVPTYNTDMVVKFAEMKTIGYEHVQDDADDIQILDARSRGRWAGTEPEPRPGLKSGHMPGSTNIPFQELLDPETKALLPAEKLQEMFKSKDLDTEKGFITTCGTGVTAAILELGLKEACFGKSNNRRLYDGSWTEWASRVSEKSNLILTEKQS